ncbi:MAG TPA: hypothetical protein VJW76_04855, partial [Verrucomicrobiae bacterium]|nr:hypothetical protein [Verrucomicrobiae bacterium]
MSDTTTELDAEDVRVWNELWDTVHSDYYACYYEEQCANYLGSLWRMIDTLTRFLSTLTASGSAVAAWTFWANNQAGATMWVVISGVAAIIALLHTSVGISDRIKEDTLIYSTFQQIRFDLESFKKKMRLHVHEKLSSYVAEYLEISSKFAKAH